MRVLPVEDDEPIAESLTRGLGRYGCEVEWVCAGEESLVAETPAHVLVDLGLPDMDGLDVCREPRARGDVPIIVISARSDEVDRVVGLEIGGRTTTSPSRSGCGRAWRGCGRLRIDRRGRRRARRRARRGSRRSACSPGGAGSGR